MVEYHEAKAAVAGLSGASDWDGVRAYMLDYLGEDAGPLIRAAEACAGAAGGSPGAMRDMAAALAFAGDVLPEGLSVSGTYGRAFGPLYALCVRYHTDRAQCANMAFLGAHGWVPGEGTGAAVMDGMAGDARTALARAGLSGFVPVDVQDGFAGLARDPYGAAVPLPVLHRALASTGMPAAEKAGIAGRLLYGRLGRRPAGPDMRTALSVLAGIGTGACEGRKDELLAPLARACAYGAALAAGREDDVAEQAPAMSVLLEGLGGTAGIDGFMAACRRMAGR